MSGGSAGVDWPAWVQAIGSVAGIFAAVGVPLWMRHLEREAARSARLTAVVIRRVTDGGLELRITYKPEERHVALWADVSLLDPPFPPAVLLEASRVREQHPTFVATQRVVTRLGPARKA